MYRRFFAALSVILVIAGCSGGGDAGTNPGAGAPPPAFSPTTLKLVAGSIGGSGNLNGTGPAARFDYAAGTAVDSAGNMYVADFTNYVIRKISPTGVVTTLAGKMNQSGDTDGTGDNARFGSLDDLVLDSKGDLIVLDGPNLRRVTPAGVVTTIFVAWTQFPKLTISRIAIDRNDNLYLSNTYSRQIYKVTTAGVLSTYPIVLGSPHTLAPTSGYIYNGQVGIAVDAAGNLYAAEPVQNRIRKIAPDGTATIFATLTEPRSMTMSQDGTLIVSSGTLVSRVHADGSATPVTITAGTPEAEACLKSINLVGKDRSENLLISTGPMLCRVVNGITTVVAGAQLEFGTAVDGAGVAARFQYVGGLTQDSTGNIYLTDGESLRKITPAGVVSTIANSIPRGHGIVMDSTGNMLAISGDTIVKVTTAGVVTPLAGNRAGLLTDGVGTAATFNSPAGITVDAAGNAYVADTGNGAIRKVTPAGVVSTIGANGASFSLPSGITIDSAGTLFIASGNSIYKVTPNGEVSRLAGSDNSGYRDGPGSQALFEAVRNISIDKHGNLYVTELYHRVRKITPSGEVSTLAGQDGKQGIQLGTLPATLDAPNQIMSDADGRLTISTMGAVLRIE